MSATGEATACSQLAAGRQRPRMEATKEGGELGIRHCCEIMLFVRPAGADRLARRESRTPKIGVQLMRAAEISRPAAHEIEIALGRVGELIVFNPQQLGIDQRV